MQSAATPRHRLLADTTSERLCSILTRQDCGAILIRDELAGWIGSMDKYGGGGRGAAQDRSIWLRAFDGGPYTSIGSRQETAGFATFRRGYRLDPARAPRGDGE